MFEDPKRPPDSPEQDQIDFERAGNIERRRRQRPRKSKDSPVPKTRQQRLEIALYVVFLTSMLLAFVFASHFTTPDFSLIGEGHPLPEPPYQQPRWLTMAYAGFGAIVLLYFPLKYAAIGFSALAKRFGRLFSLIAVPLQLLVDTMLIVVTLAMPCALVVIVCAYWITLIEAMNYRLDESKATKITTTLIEKRKGGIRYGPPEFKLTDWRSSNQPKYVLVKGYPSVFEISGTEVSFYLREGRFGWPYAIERDVVEPAAEDAPSETEKSE